MARPRKTGIDYFSVDVNMLSDRKTRRVMRSCGAQSIAVIMQLLCLAYSESGYFLSVDDNLTFDVADTLNMDESYINDVILACIEADFFNETMYEKYDILTSKRMQLNYKQATANRVNSDIENDYNLVSNEETLVLNEETADTNEETPVSEVRSTQSKAQQSKAHKSTVQNSKEEAANNDDEAISAREELPKVELQRLERTFGKVDSKLLDEYSKLKAKFATVDINDALIKTRLRSGKTIGYTATILNEDYAARA